MPLLSPQSKAHAATGMSASRNASRAPSRFDTPPQTRGEEWANAISHALALLVFALVGPFMIADAVEHGPAFVTGVSVFYACILVLYGTSTLYHLLHGGRGKDLFRKLDHVSIFLLIAGTYTPFTLGMMNGPWGWSIFGVIWGLALIGIVIASTGTTEHPVLALGLYVCMGWLVLVAIRPLWVSMSAGGLAWLFAGGIAYTLGTVFFVSSRRFAHTVFHLFVIAGTACHMVSVWGWRGPTVGA